MRKSKAVLIILGVALAVGMMQCSWEPGGKLVILVRHAEKSGIKPDPGLTPGGITRAEALAETLHDTRVDRIITSSRRRCQLTASFVAAGALGSAALLTAMAATFEPGEAQIRLYQVPLLPVWV